VDPYQGLLRTESFLVDSKSKEIKSAVIDGELKTYQHFQDTQNPNTHYWTIEGNNKNETKFEYFITLHPSLSIERSILNFPFSSQQTTSLSVPVSLVAFKLFKKSMNVFSSSSFHSLSFSNKIILIFFSSFSVYI